MKIYNTLTHQREGFKPFVPGKVSMYVCGPAVYNYTHIGNARSSIAFDTIRRYLEYKGFDVKYVSNFTDVDDKMINEARAEGITVSELAKRCTNAFMEDTTALNTEPATLHPRATEEVKDIIAFIKDLIEKGFVYEVDGDVYYRAKKFSSYGKLSDQSIASLEERASEYVNEAEFAKKEDPIDFALWKKQKQGGEIAWESPWGKGRPGRHIEYSVMSAKYLGDTIDTHGGGQDLEFPHRENEIAQSEAKTGKKFVNYRMHGGFVTVGKDEERMSKSFHNFVTVHDILRRVDPQVSRFFMADVQYRKPISYSKENLKQVTIILDKVKNTVLNVQDKLQDTDSQENKALAVATENSENHFKEVMDDDFNVQNALSVVCDLLPITNKNINESASDLSNLKQFLQYLESWMVIFGVDIHKLTAEKVSDDDSEIEELVKKRDEARKHKDFATSDAVRDQLAVMDIVLQDAPKGTKWRRG